MGKQKRKIIHSFSSENQLYLLKIDFSVVRLSRLFAMISLLLSFVSSVLLLFLVSPSILRIRNRFASKKTPLKKSRIFLRSKREKTRKKTLVTQKKTQKYKNTKKFKKKTTRKPPPKQKKNQPYKTTENWRMYCMHPTLPS